MIELALVLPVCLLIVLGIVDFGRALTFGVTVQQGTREAARLSSNRLLMSAIDDTATLRRLIEASAPALTGCAAVQTSQTCTFGTFTMTVTCSVPTGSSSTCSPSKTSGATSTVTVSGTMNLLLGWLMGYIGSSTVDVYATSSFPIL